MLFIIEGPDATGKTTLAQAIAGATGGRYSHAGPPAASALDEYVHTLEDYEPGRETRVLDRWHIGERVWPAYFGRRTDYDPVAHRYTEMFLASRGAVLIHATGDADKIIGRMRARGEDKLREDDVPVVCGQFQDLVNATQLLFLRHSVEKPVGVNALVRVAAAIETRSAHVLEVTREYVGPLDPGLLLVGDERGARHPEYGLPFMPLADSSGRWLMECVDKAAASGVKIGTTNSAGIDVQRLWSALGRPRLVALGNNALGRLGWAERVGAVPHPQYARRFWHRHRSDYAVALLRAQDGRDLRGRRFLQGVA